MEYLFIRFTFQKEVAFFGASWLSTNQSSISNAFKKLCTGWKKAVPKKGTSFLDM